MENLRPTIRLQKPIGKLISRRRRNLFGAERRRRCRNAAERPPYLRISWVTWMRLPQVSFSIAIFDAITSVGGMVKSAPRAFMRS